MSFEENRGPSNHNHQKKIAVINDISGFGRCSIVVALPIISALKVQCCPIPTSILSNHTGFDSYYFKDCTDFMEDYIREWDKLGLRFDGICSGFLGSAQQIHIVKDFISRFRMERSVVIVDPVMGDYGKTYDTYTEEMCHEMRQLVTCADIITPNLTEACILADIPYRKGAWKKDEIRELARKLLDMGPKKVVITGIVKGDYITNYCWDGIRAELNPEYKGHFIRNHMIGTTRSGTGDIFAAIIAADAVNGIPFKKSVKRASKFVRHCIIKSIELNIPVTDGVCFEEVLPDLYIYDY